VIKACSSEDSFSQRRLEMAAGRRLGKERTNSAAKSWRSWATGAAPARGYLWRCVGISVTMKLVPLLQERFMSYFVETLDALP